MDVIRSPQLPVRLDEALKNEVASEVAERLGVTAATLSAWRRGRRRPNPEQLANLCRELSVSADWLLGLSEEDLAHQSSIGPMALVTAVLEDVEGVDELDPKRVVHALLGVLHENEQLRAKLAGARKRTRIEVDNAVRDLQRKVLRGLLRAMDIAEIDPVTRASILDAMDTDDENVLRMGRQVG